MDKDREAMKAMAQFEKKVQKDIADEKIAKALEALTDEVEAADSYISDLIDEMKWTRYALKARLDSVKKLIKQREIRRGT